MRGVQALPHRTGDSLEDMSTAKVNILLNGHEFGVLVSVVLVLSSDRAAALFFSQEKRYS